MTDLLPFHDLTLFEIAFDNKADPPTVIRPVRIYCNDGTAAYAIGEFWLIAEDAGVRRSIKQVHSDYRIDPPLTPEKWACAVRQWAENTRLGETRGRILERIDRWEQAHKGEQWA